MEEITRTQAKLCASLLLTITEDNAESTYYELMQIPQNIMVQCAMALALQLKEK